MNLILEILKILQFKNSILGCKHLLWMKMNLKILLIYWNLITKNWNIFNRYLMNLKMFSLMETTWILNATILLSQKQKWLTKEKSLMFRKKEKSLQKKQLRNLKRNKMFCQTLLTLIHKKKRKKIFRWIKKVEKREKLMNKISHKMQKQKSQYQKKEEVKVRNQTLKIKK